MSSTAHKEQYPHLQRVRREGLPQFSRGCRLTGISCSYLFATSFVLMGGASLQRGDAVTGALLGSVGTLILLLSLVALIKRPATTTNIESSMGRAKRAVSRLLQQLRTEKLYAETPSEWLIRLERTIGYHLAINDLIKSNSRFLTFGFDSVLYASRVSRATVAEVVVAWQTASENSFQPAFAQDEQTDLRLQDHEALERAMNTAIANSSERGLSLDDDALVRRAAYKISLSIGSGNTTQRPS